MVIPYGKQSIDESDIAAVAEVLRSDWLTTGPKVSDFERAFAEFVGAGDAVAVSSGTAALHAAVFALGIAPGDEVIVPAITFAASANCVVFQGGKPVFADVNADTLLVDPADVESRITSRTRAIVCVDFAGQPCEYDALRAIAERRGLALLADACHSLGGSYKNRPVGTLADVNTFSLHPVKHITTGEGGMVTTDDAERARRMRIFRNHGITSDHRERERRGSWEYDMTVLGYNYRLTDFQCALGISQLRRLPAWLARRREIAARYDEAFSGIRGAEPLAVREGVSHAYHLYVIRLDPARLRTGRSDIFTALRSEGIGVNVHYRPVYLHPFYRESFRTGPGLCPCAEAAYERILSLPLYPGMSDSDVEEVVAGVRKVLEAHAA